MRKNHLTLAFASLLVLLSVGGLIFRSCSVTKVVQEVRPLLPRFVASQLAPVVASDGTKLVEVPVLCDSEGCRLPFAIEARRRCTAAGDLDLIRLDLTTASDQPTALLSLEPIDPKDDSFKPVTSPVTLEQLSAGLLLPLALPRWPGPVELGVFLCKDARHEGRCAGKTAIDLMDMVADNAMGKKRSSSYRSPDRIYFFQPLYWMKRDAVQVNHAGKAIFLTDAVLAQQIAFVTAQYSSSRAPAAESAVRRAFTLSRILRSFDLEAHDTRLNLVLPALDQDPVRCFHPHLKGEK